MNKPEKITGEWIKESYEAAHAKFAQEQGIEWNKATFVLHPAAVELNKTINSLRQMCPHKFVDGQCIYCKAKEN